MSQTTPRKSERLANLLTGSSPTKESPTKSSPIKSLAQRLSPTKSSPTKSPTKSSPTKASPTKPSPIKASRLKFTPHIDVLGVDHSASSASGSFPSQIRNKLSSIHHTGQLLSPRRRPQDLQNPRKSTQLTPDSDDREVLLEGVVNSAKEFLDSVRIPCPVIEHQGQFYEEVKTGSKSASYVLVPKETKDRKFDVHKLENLYRWAFSRINEVPNNFEDEDEQEQRTQHALRWGESPLNNIMAPPSFEDGTAFSRNIEAHLQYLSITVKDIQLLLPEDWRREETLNAQRDIPDASHPCQPKSHQAEEPLPMHNTRYTIWLWQTLYFLFFWRITSPYKLPPVKVEVGDLQQAPEPSDRLKPRSTNITSLNDQEESEQTNPSIHIMNQSIRSRSIEDTICWVSANGFRPYLDSIYNILDLTCSEARGIVQDLPQVVDRCIRRSANPRATSESHAEGLFAQYFFDSALCDRWTQGRNQCVKFPPHLKLFGCDTRPDYSLRATPLGTGADTEDRGNGLNSWPEQLLPVAFVGECKPNHKNKPVKTRAQCAASAQATLIILIIFYLDTRKSTEDPAPWWLFVPGIDYTENGFVIAAHYPRCIVDEEGHSEWGFQSMILTDRFANVLKAPKKEVKEAKNDASLKEGKRTKTQDKRKGKGRLSIKTDVNPENDIEAEAAAETKVNSVSDEGECTSPSAKDRIQSLATFLVLICQASKLLDELCKWDPVRANLALKSLQAPKEPRLKGNRSPKKQQTLKEDTLQL